MTPIPYFIVNTKSLFIPFRILYGECLQLIDSQPQASPLMCMRGPCPSNRGCMEVLAKRVNYWFQAIEPEAELMIAYFKYRNSPSLKAGIFDKALGEPRLVTLNPYGFDKMKSIGEIKHWVPTSTYLNINGIQHLPNIIPVESLIKA